ncbi:MAG: YggS family pyridoxal phosphate-dependent enzyme [Bacteroides sp.]|nr:YggS family pyridoxal phosphate-dependent enzyme [Bacteroides sp.]
MSVAEELEKLKTEIPAGVNLVAVSKFHPAEMIREAYAEGQRLFGESRVQELLEKIKELPDDIKWHFIGHLQTNKVKQLVGNVAMIESVDSERLLNLIDAESEKKGVMTRVLMQVHVAKEETKFGFLPAELKEYFSSRKFEHLTNTHICGVMGMASNTEDLERVREDFRSIANIYNEIKTVISPDLRGFDTLSMGMSHDWKIAVEEGANLIRIGSRIFGDRY